MIQEWEGRDIRVGAFLVAAAGFGMLLLAASASAQKGSVVSETTNVNATTTVAMSDGAYDAIGVEAGKQPGFGARGGAQIDTGGGVENPFQSPVATGGLHGGLGSGVRAGGVLGRR